MNTPVMVLLLCLLTAAVVAAPLWPAIQEWRKPTDDAPLPIDEGDAMDPLFMASNYARRLADQLTSGADSVGDTPLVRIRLGHLSQQLTFSKHLESAELKSGRTRRAWLAEGQLTLPKGLDGLAEIAAVEDLTAASRCTYRALLSLATLALPTEVRIVRWAHGRHVRIGDWCRLVGRVSADEDMDIGAHVSFTLLHANTIRFGLLRSASEDQASEAAAIARVEVPRTPLKSSAIEWDASTGRGVAAGSLKVLACKRWGADLVCRGDLSIGYACESAASLKAHGTLTVDSDSRIAGNAVAVGAVRLEAGVQVTGSVISETAISLGAHCVIGTPERPATVCAPRIEVGPGVIVHGTLWAGERGTTSAITAMAHDALRQGVADLDPERQAA